MERKNFWKLVKNKTKTKQRKQVKKDVPKNFAKFTGKHLYQSLFLIKPQACKFIEKETLTEVLSSEFRKIFKNTFFTEQPWATASGPFYKHLLK